MELFDEFGIELESVELNGIRHTEKVREPEQQEEITLAQVFPVDRRSVRSDIDTLVDLSRSPKATFQSAPTTADVNHSVPYPIA